MRSMRLIAFRILALLALPVLAAAVVPAQAQSDKRVALVIGNAAYKDGALKNPVNDARAMTAVLKQLGFQVISRENASKQQMERAVAEFGQALSPGAVALFYYAGHGMQVNGRNFLVPVDAQISAEHVVRLETLDLDLVLDQVAARGSDVNLVILDACRNNPFERRFRAQAGGLAQVNAPKGTMIAYATAPGMVAADGTGVNGLYTSKLVEAVKTPGMPIEEVFKKVRIEVSRETADAQTPWEASSLVGTFYFAAPATVIVNPPVDRDALYWQSVKDSNDQAQFQTYLDQFPNGAFAPLAKAKIAALQRPAPAAGQPQLAAAPVASQPPSIAAGKCAAVVGKWRWFRDFDANFSEDGQVILSGQPNAKWSCTDPALGKIRAEWPKGWVDTLTISDDGRKLEGSNQYGRLPSPVGTRIGPPGK